MLTNSEHRSGRLITFSRQIMNLTSLWNLMNVTLDLLMTFFHSTDTECSSWSHCSNVYLHGAHRKAIFCKSSKFFSSMSFSSNWGMWNDCCINCFSAGVKRLWLKSSKRLYIVLVMNARSRQSPNNTSTTSDEFILKKMNVTLNWIKLTSAWNASVDAMS